MKTLEELADEGVLVTSFETELVKQQLYDQVMQASIENRIGRNLVKVMPLQAGSTLDFVQQDKDSLEFRRVSEGAEFPIDAESYTKVSITPVKWGNIVQVTRELQEDANWDVLRLNLDTIGREAGVREDIIIFTAFNDSTYGFPSVSGQYITSAGTELSIADIANGMKAVEANDYTPDALAIHPNQLSELRQIDTFVEAHKFGTREMLATGFVGNIFGLQVFNSRTTYLGASTEYAWVVDRKAPAGILVVKRPLTLKTYEKPERDSIAVACSFREEAKVIWAKAGCRIAIS